jgi:hypothetical protein
MRLAIWFLLQEIARSENCNKFGVFTALVSQLPLDDMLKTLASLDIYSAQCSEPDNRKGPFTVTRNSSDLCRPPRRSFRGGMAILLSRFSAGFYASILDPDLTPEYPLMEDGLRQMKLLDARPRQQRKAQMGGTVDRVINART